jgi:hypothetical protein
MQARLGGDGFGPVKPTKVQTSAKPSTLTTRPRTRCGVTLLLAEEETHNCAV